MKTTIQAIRDARDADILIYAAPMDNSFVDQVRVLITEKKAHPNVFLFLATGGGDPHAAYRLARFLQGTYKELYLGVHGYCKSAGTLLCFAANKIVMADCAELGPLDVQFEKKDEVWGLESGLATLDAAKYLVSEARDSFRRHLIELVFDAGLSTRLASELATQLTIGCLQPVFAQLDPIRLGEVARANDIGVEYARRLCPSEVDMATLQKLAHQYPDHSFVIDREEAATLFPDVAAPSTEEALFCSLAVPRQPTRPAVVSFVDDQLVEQIEQAVQGATHEPAKSPSTDPGDPGKGDAAVDAQHEGGLGDEGQADSPGSEHAGPPDPESAPPADSGQSLAG